MPASERPDSEGGDQAIEEVVADAPDIDEEITRLEAAVESLADSFGAMSERASVAEANHRKLAEALRDTDLEEMAPTELQTRLEELADENGRLRAAVNEARGRADRIRSRLMLMEDEQADD